MKNLPAWSQTWFGIFHFKPIIISLGVLLILAGCARNAPWRTDGLMSCQKESVKCGTALIEEYEKYDMAFVEFSERGNVFKREDLQAVLNHVKKLRQDGVTVIVFVHGWKHNANPKDSNVKDFHDLIERTAEINTFQQRVMGIYVGWRGLSIDMGPLNNLSYWDRKAVAEQVGKGGVTELVLRLEDELRGGEQAHQNKLLVTGHSFGGAIVLSALNETILERVVSASKDRNGCLKGEPFGHGVVLLNPAIEANEALQLKEFVAEHCFQKGQPRLMHVMSSNADKATNWPFSIGQFFGVTLNWRQTELPRHFGDKEIAFQEEDLDTETVGNFVPYHTGTLLEDSSHKQKWTFTPCAGSDNCVESDDRAGHIPVSMHEPIAFTLTDNTFIADHNDVFNDKVAAYLATIVAESKYKQGESIDLPVGNTLKTCFPSQSEAFHFDECFEAYLPKFEGLKSGD